MTRGSSSHTSPPMRARLWPLVCLAAAIEMQLELRLVIPAGTPWRTVAPRAPLPALLAVYGAVVVLAAGPAPYYDHLLLPYVAPFVAAFWLGARAGSPASCTTSSGTR